MHNQADDIKAKIVINGVPSEHIKVQDRGLQYGDGLFETIAVVNGQLIHWDRHLQRLKRGCEHLKLPAPDVEQLRSETNQLIQATDRAVLKIVYTRGAGGRGYRPPEPCTPTRILSLSPWPDYPESHSQSGINLRLCEQRLGNNQTLAGLKHLNRLEQVLARSEWKNPEVAEGLMMDQRGFVIEGTMSNVFFVRDNTLCTPLLDQCGVSGIMRDVILELAEKMELNIAIDNFTPEDISHANELFMTNSLITIWPVRTLTSGKQSRNYESPGSLTSNLQSFLLKPS